MADNKEPKREELNLYQRIAEVMKAINYLQKDDKVEFGSTKYKAISEEKVTTTVREQLIKWGLVIFPTGQVSRKEGNITSVDTVYKIVNVDDPMEYETLASSGQGADTQDKGVGKAMTYAFKYVLMRTFAIPTGEDPDKISSDELTEQFKVEEKKTELADEKLIAGLKTGIEECNVDVKQLLKYVNDKYHRDVKSVDELNNQELVYATAAMNKKYGGK